MPILTFTVQDGGAGETLAVEIDRLVICGWARRDVAAMRRHVEEMRREGVAAPSTVPIFYRVGPALLTQAGGIDVLGRRSFAECEAVLVGAPGGTLVTVGSDHTDLEVERWSIPVAKQVCPKPIAERAWRLADVLPHWDSLALESDRRVGDVDHVYQRGTLAQIQEPAALIAGAFDGAGDIPSGAAMFLGTIAAEGAIAHGDAFRLRLVDPVAGRSLVHRYEVRALPLVE